MHTMSLLGQIGIYSMRTQSLLNQSSIRAKNAPRQSENLTWHIQCLWKNLRRLIMVIENAELAFRDSAFSASSRDNPPEIEALVQTCGDIGKTLEDCALFFKDEFRLQSDRYKRAYAAPLSLLGGIHLKDLCRRLALHNIKAGFWWYGNYTKSIANLWKIVTVVKAFERYVWLYLKRLRKRYINCESHCPLILALSTRSVLANVWNGESEFFHLNFQRGGWRFPPNLRKRELVFQKNL